MYAIDTLRQVLVEFKTKKEFKTAQSYWCDSARSIGPTLLFKKVHYTQAHAWVKKGDTHETLLFVDRGKIRRA